MQLHGVAGVDFLAVELEEVVVFDHGRALVVGLAARLVVAGELGSIACGILGGTCSMFVLELSCRFECGTSDVKLQERVF